MSANLGKVQRPKLTMEIGGKIPHMLRQRYLDKIIDEIMPKCASEKEAFEKVWILIFKLSVLITAWIRFHGKRSISGNRKIYDPSHFNDLEFISTEVFCKVTHKV